MHFEMANCLLPSHASYLVDSFILSPALGFDVNENSFRFFFVKKYKKIYLFTLCSWTSLTLSCSARLVAVKVQFYSVILSVGIW